VCVHGERVEQFHGEILVPTGFGSKITLQSRLFLQSVDGHHDD
jgi:hypothetical protein